MNTSITANEVKARSVVGNDYEYAHIGLTWKGKNYLEIPTECEKTQVMWSHESVYGVIGSKVGDFIEHYGVNSSLQEGIFTKRKIAELLISNFTGLKFNELNWIENPLEKTLSNGKPRVKKPKWLPKEPLDLVHLYSDVYISVCDPTPPKTDFFNAIRPVKDEDWSHTWLMCNDLTAQKLHAMNFSCLDINKITVNAIKHLS